METIVWDPAEHLDSDEAVLAYLNAAFEDGDPDLVVAALKDVGRARGIQDLPSPTAGLGRSAGTQGPEFATIRDLLKSLGLGLSARSLTAPSV